VLDFSPSGSPAAGDRLAAGGAPPVPFHPDVWMAPDTPQVREGLVRRPLCFWWRRHSSGVFVHPPPPPPYPNTRTHTHTPPPHTRRWQRLSAIVMKLIRALMAVGGSLFAPTTRLHTIHVGVRGAIVTEAVSGLWSLSTPTCASTLSPSPHTPHPTPPPRPTPTHTRFLLAPARSHASPTLRTHPPCGVSFARCTAGPHRFLSTPLVCPEGRLRMSRGAPPRRLRPSSPHRPWPRW
jgi:hypothetical protein